MEEKDDNFQVKQQTVEELSESLRIFGTADYAVFITMLVSCSIVGFYFGFVNHKLQKSSNNNRRGSEALNYLMGGRNMKFFPVALSLIASFMSGISLLGLANFSSTTELTGFLLQELARKFTCMVLNT